ncbi:MAG: protein translocase subunit SecF [Acidobacteriota bacterium]|nr:protein translocase subunit SecF [Acidobacteriota bacterium]
MQLFGDSRFDFMKYRRVMVPVSLVAFVLSLGALATVGLNMGIDFAGGTQLVVRFRDPPEVDGLRDLLEGAGIADAGIQSFGDEGDNEVLIKTPLVVGQDEGQRDEVVAALDGAFNSGSGDIDLNQQGAATLATLLVQQDPDDQLRLGDDVARAYYDGVAKAVLEVRRQSGLIADWSQIEVVEGVSSAAMSTIQGGASLGSFAVLGGGNVGPQIGSELRNRGVLAVVFSLFGMMAYIWYRFELRFGVGALVALVHDVVIALGLYVVLGYEFDVTSIAAFLTVVGYSVNDSVVIFDRVRENLRRTRRESLVTVINHSLNQTLSRTLLTSGTTLLAVSTLFVFGGDVLRGFSFVLMMGVLVGTYSSIFVASPTVLLWERLRRGR